jgi:leucyl aminopeptidase
MKIEVRAGALDKAEGLIAYAAFEGDGHPDRLAPASSAVQRLAAGSGLRGAANETSVLPLDARWVVVVGVGKSKDASLDRLRQFGATAARAARHRGFTHLTLPLITEKIGTAEQAARAIVEGALLGLYRYDRLRKLPKHEQGKRLDGITVSVERATDLDAAKRGAARGQTLAEAVSLVRDLVNGPSNLVTPTLLAHTAKDLANRHGLTCQVTPFAQLKKQGFGGIAGVGQGSAHPAQLIVLDYAPAKPKATVALCGKGITFDSGGISLKPAEKMEQMKYDMSGAAAVLGTMRAAAALKLSVRIVGIIAATENLPSGTAQKPGDVLTTLSGKTVEVINTDAEGRLVLADCLHFAKRFTPDCTIDLATLTGACVVALGSEAIGLFSKDDRLAQRLIQAGQATHERVWRLPLWDEYASLIKSDIADLKNAGGREAGAVTAAKFLEEFADGMSWAHLDIAGTAWTERDKPYVPKGAVGVGVRLLIEFLDTWA